MEIGWWKGVHGLNEGLGEESLIVWLGNIEKNQSKDKRYRHTLLKEKNEYKLETMEPLKIIFKKAHEDARRRLRKAFEISLDPFDVDIWMKRDKRGVS